MKPTGSREPYAGKDEGPEQPFPIKLSGPVIKGFGRGSRELGIPTANIPPSGLSAYPDLQSGVYFGFVGLKLGPETMQEADNSKLTLSASSGTSSTTTETSSSSSSEAAPSQTSTTAATTTPPTTTSEAVQIYPAVLSIGFNPFYSNPTRSIEIHILHHFPHYNFYHSPLNLLVLGFIRPEYDYDSLDALVEDIKTDCDVARRSLQREGWKSWRGDEWLRGFEWVGDVDVGQVEGEVLRGDKKDSTL